MLNVFEHQKFLLRRRSSSSPLGERVELSFRDLMLLPDEDDHGLRFDYPIEYFNVAALGLCAALAQTLFEPATVGELVDRIERPLSPEVVDERIRAFADRFTIDGTSGPRFMQGPEPARDKKGRFDAGPLWDLLLTVKKGDKYFLNRPAPEWAVRLDQIALLLFSRATFYEKSAGRGYLTGTSGDLEVRTFPVDPTSLRKTIWLNVLARASFSEKAYATADDAGAYSGFMWSDPPKDDVAQGDLSLVSGLFWMVANAYIVIEDVPEGRRCIVSGEPVQEGRAGTGVVVTATGKGYGVKVAREKGPEVRQSFFRHPNGPFEWRQTKDGNPFPKHFSVSETQGLIGNMGGLFYAGLEGNDLRMASVVEQLYRLRRVFRQRKLRFPLVDLLCFGFHMLSSKANVHGGYEYENFHYPIVGELEEDPVYVLTVAQNVMVNAERKAKEIEEELCSAIQRCTMVQMGSTVKEAKVFEFNAKRRLTTDELMKDAARELWNRLGGNVRELLDLIRRNGDSAGTLNDAADEIQEWWTNQAGRHAIDLFDRVFYDFSGSPLYLIAAHKARGRFFGALKKLGVKLAKSPTADAQTTTQSTEASS
jgi:CRISPR type I-E-associated protein CasA/Cse1